MNLMFVLPHLHLKDSPQRTDGFATQEILETNEVFFLIESDEPIKICFRNGKKVE